MNLWEQLNNPHTSGDVLAQLYYQITYQGEQRYALLEALARHPNCPPETIKSLLLVVPQAVVENPAWSLLLLEGGLLGAQEPVLEQLRLGELPYAYLELLCQHPNAQVRAQAAEHVCYAGEVEGHLEEALVRKLGTLRRDGRLVWLARAGLFPEWLQDYLPHPVVPSPVRPPRRPGKRQDPWAEVVASLHAGTAPPIFDETPLTHYARTSGELVPLLALAQTSLKSVLREYYQGVWPWKRLGVALNPRSLSTESFKTHPHDPDVKDTNRSILGYLASDGNRWVRAVARRRLADPRWLLF